MNYLTLTPPIANPILDGGGVFLPPPPRLIDEKLAQNPALLGKKDQKVDFSPEKN